MHLAWSQVRAEEDCVSLGYNGFNWLWYPTAVDCDMGYTTDDYYRQGTGLRFQQINIPPGSKILIATLLLCAWANYDVDVVRSYINAQLDANPQPFTTLEDYWARTRTRYGTPWDEIRHFKHRQWYPSPNFASHIQQVIDLPDWHSGNPIVIFWNDHGDRSDHIPVCCRHAYAWSVEPTRAPYLRITYLLPGEIPPPTIPETNWAVEKVEQILTLTGFKIIATTDRPCHLFLRWTNIPPRKHKRAVRRRGIIMHWDVFFCFDVYTDNEQIEPGDTLIHTFYKEPWPYCETRWFYFHGLIGENSSPSTTAIFEKHREAKGMMLILEEPWTELIPPPPEMEQIFLEPWTWTPPPPPTFEIIFFEPWSQYFPTMQLIFLEPWTYFLPPAPPMEQVFLEPWTEYA